MALDPHTIWSLDLMGVRNRTVRGYPIRESPVAADQDFNQNELKIVKEKKSL